MKIARDNIVSKILFWGAILILILYPLRHVGIGVDLWDAGYNYANFRYPGLEYMDSMWYYATWLANQVGAFLIRLPFAGTMLGVNIYTGLLVSLIAVISWLFAVKKMGMPGNRCSASRRSLRAMATSGARMSAERPRKKQVWASSR